MCVVCVCVQNYVSCLDSDGPPLSEPTAQYQVLNKDSGNRVLFPEYNGMYIFKAIVVDPRYRLGSVCVFHFILYMSCVA